ncbi:peptidase inhibitor family I36 protein [Spirillospora sp. NBC_00431]
MSHRLAAILAATAAGFALLAGGGAAGAAAPDPTQQKINQLLTESPGGVQTSKNTVAWENGAIVYTVARKGATIAAAACEAGRFCLYENNNFGGSVLSFSERICDNRIINLPSFNFNDKTSSWADNANVDVDVWADTGAGGSRIFQMFAFTESPGLPRSINDRASSLNCF